MSEIDRLALPASAKPEQRGNGEAVGMRTHRDSPMRRKMASGRVVWLARYTRSDGTRAYWKPEWNGGRATFKHTCDAQRAIDEAHVYHARHGWETPDTVGACFEPGRSVKPSLSPSRARRSAVLSPRGYCYSSLRARRLRR
jgi:hypothetical protein